jgi:hypothetical protein
MKIIVDCDQSIALRFKLGDGWMDAVIILYNKPKAKGLAHGVLDLMRNNGQWTRIIFIM